MRRCIDDSMGDLLLQYDIRLAGLLWLIGDTYFSALSFTTVPHVHSVSRRVISSGGNFFCAYAYGTIQNEIGVPERLYSIYLVSGVSFGDLVAEVYLLRKWALGYPGPLCAIIGGLFIPA